VICLKRSVSGCSYWLAIFCAVGFSSRSTAQFSSTFRMRNGRRNLHCGIQQYSYEFLATTVKGWYNLLILMLPGMSENTIRWSLNVKLR
jgi:hypothetical protein